MRLLAEIALIALAAAGVAVCLALLPRPAPRDRARMPLPASRPDQLARLEHLVAGASLSALQAHAHLRPLLARVAAQRLAAHGLALERIPEPLAQELLGARLWELVRPGRPFPAERRGPGVTAGELGEMLDSLERL